MPFKRIIERLKDALVDVENLFLKKESKVSLVIPAFNEEKTVARVIGEARKVKGLSEIILVDDGSVDKTPEIAEKLEVNVIRHHSNLGKGEALRTGIYAAK